MRAFRFRVAFFSLVFGAGVAGAEPPATPVPTPAAAPQHVTAPSLPGEKNKEGTVTPDTGMPTDSEGYAVTKRYDPKAPASKKSPAAAGSTAGAPAGPAAGTTAGPATVPAIPVGPAPSGKAVATGANYLNVRGSLVSMEAGKSVTIRIQKTGTENTYTLAPGATVAPGLEAGKTVRVRVLAAEKGKVADNVELVAPEQPATEKKEKKP